MKKTPNTIKNILKKDFLLLTLVPVAIFIFIFMLYLLGYVKNKEETEQNMMLDIIEAEIQKIFDSNILLLNEINNTITKGLIKKEDINFYLEDIIKRHEMFDSIRIVDKNGNVLYAPEKEKDIIGFNVSYQDYYISAMKSKEDYLSKVFISAETSKATMAISLKSKDEKLIISYYSLGQLQKKIDKIPKKSHYNIAVVNFQGNFIAHSDFTKVVERENEKYYDKLKNDGNYVLNYDNNKVLVSSLSLPDPGFTIIIYKPFLESYNIVGKLLIFSLLCAVFIIVVTGIFASIKTKPIVNTISELINQTSKISHGNYEICLADSNILELNELKENFNSMANIINEMFTGLSESQAELEILNEDLCRQNEEIKKNEEQISLIINSIYDGIIVLDSKFNIIWINNIALNLFGIDKKMIKKDTKCYELFYTYHSKCFNCDMEIVKLSKGKFSNVVKRGNKFIEETYFPNFNEVGEFKGVIKTFRDITDKVTIETKLNRAVKMEAIGRLTGGIAHDFNNILQVIIGYTDLVIMQMKETKENENILPKMQTIYETAIKAEKLIKKLMTFSKIDQTSPKDLNINLIIKETTAMLSSIIGDDIELILNLDDTIPNIFADPTQIEQIIMNLCINAKDSMQNGGSIEIITYQVIKNDINYVVLKVVDTGTGISVKIREKIFDPFFTTKEIGKGTGLGLSIVLGIVEKLNGFIKFDTEVGKGTTFSIFLPPSNTQVMISKNDNSVNETKSLVGLNILLAEDNASVRSFASIVLKNEGVNLIEAVDGRDALKKFMDNKDIIDIIVLDAIMPHINGVEVYKRVKKLNPNIKVIFTTGYSSDYFGKDYNLLLQGKLLEKPYKSEELVRAIVEVM